MTDTRTAFRPGDRVDVVIRAARVMEPAHSQDTALTLAYAETEPGVYATITLDHPDTKAVELTRVAPAEWPPEIGDLWRDRDGKLWFVYRYENTSGATPRVETRLTCSSSHSYSGWMGPDQLVAEFGPLTLVHREHRDQVDADL